MRGQRQDQMKHQKMTDEASRDDDAAHPREKIRQKKKDVVQMRAWHVNPVRIHTAGACLRCLLLVGMALVCKGGCLPLAQKGTCALAD